MKWSVNIRSIQQAHKGLVGHDDVWCPGMGRVGSVFYQ